MRLTEEDRMKEALVVLEKLNPLRNDFDAYLLHIAKWGLGTLTDGDDNPTSQKPQWADYGLDLKGIVE